MIAIVDLGLGNLFSVRQALQYLKIPCTVTSDSAEIRKASKLILPGVGNFYKASEKLRETGLGELIRKEVLEQGKPILGICLGMQLMAAYGEEGGGSPGLGLIPGRIRLLRSEDKSPRLPHVGWDDVQHGQKGLFAGIPDNACFYFVHSYALMEFPADVETATCEYEILFAAAFQKGHIAGFQFHPEKSQKHGLKLLENFTKSVHA